MSKNIENELAGQPILNQILQLVDKITPQDLVKKEKSDRYYKTFIFDHILLR